MSRTFTAGTSDSHNEELQVRKIWFNHLFINRKDTCASFVVRIYDEKKEIGQTTMLSTSMEGGDLRAMIAWRTE